MKNKFLLLIAIFICTFYISHKFNLVLSNIFNSQVFAQEDDADSEADDDMGDGGSSDPGPAPDPCFRPYLNPYLVLTVTWDPCPSTRGPGIQSGYDQCNNYYSQDCCTPGEIYWDTTCTYINGSYGPGIQSGSDGCTTHTRSCCVSNCTATNSCNNGNDGCGNMICNNDCSSVNKVCVGQVCIVPTPYPTIHIAGGLKNDFSTTENKCSDTYTYPSHATYTPTLTLTPGGAGSSSSCTPITYGGTTYACDVTINNVVNVNIEPKQTIYLSNTGYPGAIYKTYWIGPCTINNCPQSNDCQQRNGTIVADVSQSNPSFNKNIYLSTDEVWFRLKNASFNNASSNERNNIVPQNVTKYDNVDDTTDSLMIIGQPGIINTYQKLYLVNSNNYSANNWINNGYRAQKTFSNSQAYIDYVRQKFSDISEINDLNNIGTSPINTKIFIYKSNLTIDNTNLALIDKKNLTLVVDGNIDFNLGDKSDFNPTNSIVLVAKGIKFYNKNTDTTPDTNWSGLIKYAKGVFVADMIDLGSSIDSGIKIKGNLISLTGPIADLRKQTDNSKATVFVVFDPKIYLDTISTFGSTTYNWSILN